MRIRRAVHLSEMGPSRKVNGDAVLSSPDTPVFGVVDATGGSDVAQTVIRQLVLDSEVLRDRGQRVIDEGRSASRLAIGQFFEALFDRASKAIRDGQQDRTPVQGFAQAASSAVAATVIGRFAYVAHVGDVRAYLYRDGELRRLTSDDTLAMLQLERDEITLNEYSTSPFRHTLTQALGLTQVLDVHTAEVRLQSEDTFLLCSNGLTRMLKDSVIHQTLREHASDLEKASQELLKRARSSGANDDVSVVLFQVSATEATQPMIASVVDVVQRAYFFNRLSPTQWLAVAPYLEEDELGEGETLYRAGDRGDAIYIVADGLISLDREDGSARQVLPGQHFGGVCLANPSPRMETARALEDTHIFSFSRRALEKIVTYKPDLGARITLTLAEVLGAQLTDVHGGMTKVRKALAGWAISPNEAVGKSRK